MKTIAYLGPAGTYSEEAAIQYAPDAEYVPFSNMPAVVQAFERGEVTHAILPIENVLEGSVTTTLDLLIHETETKIIGETVLPIRQILVARSEMALSDIQVLYGHPQSLGQCRKFIERYLPKVTTIASLSNSAAPAEALADERPAAAISTFRAAELTGAHILARDINDRADNVTRFIVLGHEKTAPTGDDRTSFCFGFRENRPGVLIDALKELVNINLSKLESRPSKYILGEYIFLVDINGHSEEPHVAAALDRIRAKTGMLKIFGSYPCYRGPSAAEQTPGA